MTIFQATTINMYARRRILRSMVVTVISVVGTSCISVPLTSSGSQGSDGANAIVALADDILAAASARDADRFASFFSGRPEFVYLINTRRIISRDSLRATFAGMLSRQRRFEAGWTDRGVQMLSEDVGMFTGAFETRAEPITGEPWQVRGVVTFAAVRESVGWRVVNWHTTEQPF
jgi:ketosteroid isomerase-like protein